MPSSYVLGSHLEAFVRRQLDSGQYEDESEVVRDGLRLLEEQATHRQAKLGMHVGISTRTISGAEPALSQRAAPYPTPASASIRRRVSTNFGATRVSSCSRGNR